MTRCRMLAALAVLAVLASALAPSRPALAYAMTNDMELVFAHYHMAIRAALLCRGVTPDDATWRRWSSYIDRKTGYEIGAGARLFAIEGAKTDVRIMVARKGCESGGVGDLLKLYDQELAGLAKP
ncbi:MAG TPA: hypothetical protein VGM59_11180 [Dongiaceae bacterium]